MKKKYKVDLEYKPALEQEDDKHSPTLFTSDQLTLIKTLFSSHLISSFLFHTSRNIPKRIV